MSDRRWTKGTACVGVRNQCVEAERGDVALVAAAIDEAEHVVRLSTRNHRVYGSPIEPPSGVASFDLLLVAMNYMHRARGCIGSAVLWRARSVSTAFQFG